jgi:hypothetical protein
MCKICKDPNHEILCDTCAYNVERYLNLKARVRKLNDELADVKYAINHSPLIIPNRD